MEPRAVQGRSPADQGPSHVPVWVIIALELLRETSGFAQAHCPLQVASVGTPSSSREAPPPTPGPPPPPPPPPPPHPPHLSPNCMNSTAFYGPSLSGNIRQKFTVGKFCEMVACLENMVFKPEVFLCIQASSFFKVCLQAV